MRAPPGTHFLAALGQRSLLARQCIGRRSQQSELFGLHQARASAPGFFPKFGSANILKPSKFGGSLLDNYQTCSIVFCSVVRALVPTESERVNASKRMAESDLLSEKQVATELFRGLISVRTLQTRRREHRGPAYLKLGRRVVYRRNEVLAYFDRTSILTEVPAVMPK
jgi:hypothetical protein